MKNLTMNEKNGRRENMKVGFIFLEWNMVVDIIK